MQLISSSSCTMKLIFSYTMQPVCPSLCSSQPVCPSLCSSQPVSLSLCSGQPVSLSLWSRLPWLQSSWTGGLLKVASATRGGPEQCHYLHLTQVLRSSHWQPRLWAPMPTHHLDLRVPAPEFPEEVKDDLPLLSELLDEVEDDLPLLPAHLLSVSAVAAVFLFITTAALQHLPPEVLVLIRKNLTPASKSPDQGPLASKSPDPGPSASKYPDPGLLASNSPVPDPPAAKPLGPALPFRPLHRQQELARLLHCCLPEPARLLCCSRCPKSLSRPPGLPPDSSPAKRRQSSCPLDPQVLRRELLDCTPDSCPVRGCHPGYCLTLVHPTEPSRPSDQFPSCKGTPPGLSARPSSSKSTPPWPSGGSCQ